MLPTIPMRSPSSTQCSAESLGESPERTISIQEIAEIAYGYLKSHCCLTLMSYANSKNGIFYSSFCLEGLYYKVQKSHRQAPGLLEEIRKIAKQRNKRISIGPLRLHEGFFITRKLYLEKAKTSKARAVSQV